MSQLYCFITAPTLPAPVPPASTRPQSLPWCFFCAASRILVWSQSRDTTTPPVQSPSMPSLQTNAAMLLQTINRQSYTITEHGDGEGEGPCPTSRGLLRDCENRL